VLLRISAAVELRDGRSALACIALKASAAAKATMVALALQE
jgi:hypothetical protein